MQKPNSYRAKNKKEKGNKSEKKLRNSCVAKKWMSHIFFVKFLVFKQIVSQIIRCIGLKFQGITDISVYTPKQATILL